MRRAVLALIPVVLGALVGVGAVYYYHFQNILAASDHSSCSDPGSISSHVYNPDRLDIIKSCITASGIVDRVLQEADGDYHIRLALDSQYSNLINQANIDYQYGDLVVEIICARQITQPDAVSACQNYANTISIPDTGQHITVTGPYVLDTAHFGWAEIHPAYTLTMS